jgi:hypothetical protein
MALSLNGSSSYIGATSTPITAAPFSMACWFNPLSATAGGVLMAIGNSAGTDRFQLAANGDQANDPITFYAQQGASNATASATGYVLNTWQHAAAVCSGVTSRSIFRNGAQKNTNTTSIIPASLNSILIGARWSGGARGSFFNGRIAEAAIWNVALTDDEVLSLSKGFAPSLIRPSNLRFYNRCLRTSQDLSQGRTLTQVNITNFDHPRIYG